MSATAGPATFAGTPATAGDDVRLAIGGMSGAACAACVERELNRLDGVSASVDVATATAAVRFDPARTGAPELVDAVRAAGFTATAPAEADVQRRIDRVAAVFVAAVVAFSLATAGLWLGAGAGAAQAIAVGIAVLIVACPCALVLVTPAGLLVGTGRGAQPGVLTGGAHVFAPGRRIDTVVLNKTGTATTGRMRMHGIAVTGSVSRDEALALVGALAARSEHPLGGAIARAATERLGALPAAERFAAIAGRGVEGTVDGIEVVAGRVALLAERGFGLPAAMARAVTDAEAAGFAVVAAGWDGSVRAMFAVGDTVKPSSPAAVRELRRLGLHPILLTGDNAAAAHAAAEQLGIEQVVADVLPAGKADVIARLQAEGHVVAMIGDGIEDAAALARADVGIALGDGTDAAIGTSHLTVVSSDLRAAVDAIRLLLRTRRTIRLNRAWAFGSTAVMLALAAAGFVSPLLACGAMALSSAFVVTNSRRLRRFVSLRDVAAR